MRRARKRQERQKRYAWEMISPAPPRLLPGFTGSAARERGKSRAPRQNGRGSPEETGDFFFPRSRFEVVCSCRAISTFGLRQIFSFGDRFVRLPGTALSFFVSRTVHRAVMSLFRAFFRVRTCFRVCFLCFDDVLSAFVFCRGPGLFPLLFHAPGSVFVFGLLIAPSAVFLLFSGAPLDAAFRLDYG